MRKTCGAACGLFMLAGLETGCTEGSNREGKEENYKTVQMLAREFERRNGSLTCAELLGLSKQAPTPPTKWWKRQPEYGKSIVPEKGSKSKIPYANTISHNN